MVGERTHIYWRKKSGGGGGGDGDDDDDDDAIKIPPNQKTKASQHKKGGQTLLPEGVDWLMAVSISPSQALVAVEEEGVCVDCLG